MCGAGAAEDDAHLLDGLAHDLQGVQQPGAGDDQHEKTHNQRPGGILSRCRKVHAGSAQLGDNLQNEVDADGKVTHD